MKTGTQMADWAVREIESKYKDDVCLLLEHRTFRLEEDRVDTSFSFYIPATSRANGLARTFIINGIGYDLFPMSWERIEGIANVKEYITSCVADAEILYARTEDDRQRFLSLQARLQANLQNPHYMYNKATEWLNTAVDMYQDMLFEENLYKVREKAGDICNVLSVSIASFNQRYFKHGQTDQIKELLSMKEVPAGFTDLYERIVRVKMANEQKKLCHDMIVSTKAFLTEHDKNAVRRISAPDFSELASWYHELSYTWHRVYHWCDKNDPINAYIWCCLLQNEVDGVGKDYGIAELDILGAFDADNLPAFRKRAEFVEQKFVEAIEANGVTIDSYPTIEDFLKKNP